ncbi:hypothetical protein KC660_03570 [Candidatus Dojkabacteria bacterium]|uniref:Phosphotyrosine protein phosphatase I domain-containing protein n=1 Tax=Candidatus Dojkabacteria bacterium TaxID=2099670 RepID=A0A955L4G4_9BACT|nr:hypothetical protein [Candidatus Dojkabacteria bacterium]
MHIHFVCSGNTYRSRIAETHLNSLKLPNTNASSSGINADKNINGPITWPALWLIKTYNLINFVAPSWKQTNAELLNNADFVIFMEDSVFNACKQKCGFRKNRFQVWNIPDLDMSIEDFEGDEYLFALYSMNFTEKIYKKIVSQTKQLLIEIN